MVCSVGRAVHHIVLRRSAAAQCIGGETCDDYSLVLSEDIWEADEDAISLAAEPVMRQQEVQVSRTVVDGHDHGHREEVLAVGAGTSWSRCELHTGIILALQLVLMLCQEVEVANIVQNDAIVPSPVKAAHGFWEDLQASHLKLQRSLEQGFCPFRLACLGWS